MRSGVQVAVSTMALAAIAVLFVFHPLTPALPLPGIDASWVAVMGEAADRPARWGVDTIFTYGPASPLTTGYLDAGWLDRTVPLQLGFAALFGWCTALLVASGRPAGVAAAGTAACGLMLAAARGTPDAFFLSLPLPVLLLALRRRSRADTAASLAGAFALGLTAMVKTSFPLAALPLVLLGDAAGLTRRRWPALSPAFAIGVVSGALLYGQRLADLPAYAARQGEVVAGYAAAMAIDGPDWDIAPFAVLALGLLVTALLARRSPGRWPVSLGLGVMLLVQFKAGFIRHDLHSLIAWTGLCLAATVLAWGWLPRRASLGITAAACFVVVAYEPVMTVRQSVRGGRGPALSNLYEDWLIGGPRREVAAAARLLRDPAGFRPALEAAKSAAWAGIADAGPLPALAGSVDIIPSRQSRVLAAGLAYRGRPSFQEYGTYTAGLAAANRAFIEGPQAPRWVLFGPESPLGFMTIDGRFPSSAEGALWPDLLRLYRPDHRLGDLVALVRRDTPAPLALGPARGFTAGFDTFSTVDADGPLWATLDVRPNLAGRILSALFRPPPLRLAVRLDDGSERRFRLVPALAADGFLLSPLVDNASDYEALSAGRPAGPGRRVAALAVEATPSARLFYAPAIAVTLRSMDASGLGPGVPPAATAWASLAASAGTRGDRVAVPWSGLLSLPLSGLPVVDGLRHVALGIALDAGAAPDQVCFAFHPADGTDETLARRCLDPATGGRGSATLAADVPESVTELALEATCGERPCPAAWTPAQPTAAASR